MRIEIVGDWKICGVGGGAIELHEDRVVDETAALTVLIPRANADQERAAASALYRPVRVTTIIETPEEAYKAAELRRVENKDAAQPDCSRERHMVTLRRMLDAAELVERPTKENVTALRWAIAELQERPVDAASVPPAGERDLLRAIGRAMKELDEAHGQREARDVRRGIECAGRILSEVAPGVRYSAAANAAPDGFRGILSKSAVEVAPFRWRSADDWVSVAARHGIADGAIEFSICSRKADEFCKMPAADARALAHWLLTALGEREDAAHAVEDFARELGEEVGAHLATKAKLDRLAKEFEAERVARSLAEEKLDDCQRRHADRDEADRSDLRATELLIDQHRVESAALQARVDELEQRYKSSAGGVPFEPVSDMSEAQADLRCAREQRDAKPEVTQQECGRLFSRSVAEPLRCRRAPHVDGFCSAIQEMSHPEAPAPGVVCTLDGIPCMLACEDKRLGYCRAPQPDAPKRPGDAVVLVREPFAPHAEAAQETIALGRQPEAPAPGRMRLTAEICVLRQDAQELGRDLRLDREHAGRLYLTTRCRADLSVAPDGSAELVAVDGQPVASMAMVRLEDALDAVARGSRNPRCLGEDCGAKMPCLGCRSHAAVEALHCRIEALQAERDDARKLAEAWCDLIVARNKWVPVAPYRRAIIALGFDPDTGKRIDGACETP